MWLSDVSVKRPVLATVMSLLLVVAGVLAFFTVPLRELPDIDPPVVSIETIYPGASAAVMEREITRELEDQVSGVDGIRSISSSSRDGISRVTIEFMTSRDIDDAANDVRDAVSRIAGFLPDEAETPQVLKVDADSDPFLWLQLTSDTMSSLELSDYAERMLLDRFTALEGVARVWVGGAQTPAMRIWVDPLALAARTLTVGDVEAALRDQNIELPAGRVEAPDRTFGVRVERNYTTPEDFAALVIARGEDGHLIRLGEVARVEIGPEEPRSLLRGNAETQVGIGVVRQSRSNILDVRERVMAEADRIRATLPPDISLFESFDRTMFVRAAIDEVWKTLAIAGVAVLTVIALFLGSLRAALIPAVTVPVSLAATMIVFWLFGLSLNLLTLLALVLTIGLVVDDAIVMLENVQRRLDKGEPGPVAAYRGARQVGFAILATTAVLVAVFLPMTIMIDTTGLLFRELALTVAAAVVASSFIALSLTPMMCSKLLRARGGSGGRAGDESAGAVAGWINRGFARVNAGYRRIVAGSIRMPLLVGGIGAATFGAIYALWSDLPTELAPPEDRGAFNFILVGPEGASYEYMRERSLEAERIIMEQEVEGTGDVRRLMLRTPAGFGPTERFNTAFFIVVLADFGERERTTREIVADLMPKLQAQTGYRTIPLIGQTLGSQGSRPVQFIIGGSTYEELAAWRDAIMERAEAHPSMERLQSDYFETLPRLKIDIDRTRAADLGVSVREIGRTLETLFAARRVTSFSDRGEEYEVMLQAEPAERSGPEDLANTYVRSERTGALIPLANLVTIRDTAEPGELNRYNRLRAITISANIADGHTLGEALAALDEMAAEIAPGAEINYGGASREFRESSNTIYFVFGLALLVVFLVLAAQFESFVHPVTIMTTVPLGVAGALFGLWLFDSSLNIYSQIGIIILIGIAAKNGILIVEFANQLREAGRDLAEATVEAAAIRLRPILMTSLSTAIGALPLAMATGAGAESRFTIGITIVSGVLIATLFTLIVVPAVYFALARFTGRPGRIARTIEEWERERPRTPATAIPNASPQGTPAE